jgi:hypothetical protein
MKKNLLKSMSTLSKSAFVMFFILFAFAVFTGYCQDNVKVQLTKTSFLYRNADNPATVTIPGTAQKDIKITISDGTIVSGSNGYTFKPSKVGTAVVSVFVKDKLMKKVEFKVIDLVAKVNGHKSGDIDKSLLLTNAKLTAEVEGAELPIKFKVVSFGVSAMINGDQVSVNATGELLTNEQINLIKKLGPGDVMLISPIKVTGSDGTQRELPDAVFTLK